MTVGNAGYPAKCTLLLLKKGRKLKRVENQKRKTKLKLVLNSIGVSF